MIDLKLEVTLVLFDFFEDGACCLVFEGLVVLEEDSAVSFLDGVPPLQVEEVCSESLVVVAVFGRDDSLICGYLRGDRAK